MAQKDRPQAVPAALSVPDDMLREVRAFVEGRRIPLDVTAEPEGTVRVVRPAGREQSDPDTLRAGGWIACPTALEMAARLGIEPLELGALLDFLDIKVRACALGCFK